MPHHLAQINIARGRAPLDSPVMRGFVEQLDSLNALAETSSGFVWRLKTESGNATDIRAFDDPLIIVNLSVWSGIETLRDFAYRSAHAHAFRRRKEWFEDMDAPSMALWWIPAGSLPTVDQGKERLGLMARVGPTCEAFTFRNVFTAPG
jgi:hypothetical protein